MKKALLASAAAIPDVPIPQLQKKPDKVLEKIARSAARPRESAARRRRPRSRGARRDAGDEDAGEGGGDGEPDTLVPDPAVCREFGISAMSLWRWDRDPELNFPARIVIGRRNYRSRKELEKFKRSLLRRAVAQRSREARG